MIARDILEKIEKEHLKKTVTPFNVGDTIKVHTKVIEGGKERLQAFQGIVLARRGTGVNASFTVRKISYGEGVERVFPLHSPAVDRIEVISQGRVRRSKLYYLRDRVGKSATKVKGVGRNVSAPTAPAAPEAAAAEISAAE
ncbi:MAG: 50S ribosomal protein L19 [Verrucomicrobiales bacterium]